MAFTDAFTDTNGVDLEVHNTTWVKGTGSGVNEIQSNAMCGLDGDTTSNSFHYWNDTFAASHYSQAVVAAGGLQAIGPCIRAQAAAQSFYYCYLYAPSAAVFPGECVGGTGTDWDSGQAEALVGDTFGLFVDASTTTTIYYKKNAATIATYTSKSALSGGKAGVARYQGSNATRIDDWEGGDVGGATGWGGLLGDQRNRLVIS